MRRLSGRICGTLTWLTTAIVGGANPALGQDHEGVIGNTPTCPDCRIELHPAFTIGDVDGGGVLAGEPRFLLRMPGQGWILAEYPIGTRLLLFDEEGGFIRRLARPGDGPGEFRSITTATRDPSGQLHVFDGTHMRRTTFDANLKLVDTELHPALRVHGFAIDTAGVSYFNADALNPESIGYPLHVFDERGDIQSFGIGVPIYRPDAPWLGQRAIAGDSLGVWTSRRTHYQIEWWLPSGIRAASWERQADWFEPYLMRAMPTPEEPPNPWVSAIRLLPGHRLAVAISVPAADFAQKLEVRQVMPDGRKVYHTDSCDDLFDTVVEVVDLVSGDLLARQVVEPCILGFSGEMAYGYRLEAGIPRIGVYRFEFVVP